MAKRKPLDPASGKTPCLRTIDLSPAKWVWLPSQRTLSNTFVLFRRVLCLEEKPVKASGWVSADSRYVLSVNGRRVQRGPAPCDPRWLDADPVDLLPFLSNGENVVGAEVLYYGFGDGTWPAGKPGFIMNVELEYPGGRTERLATDAQWLCLLDRSRRPGQYKRWYLRSLQEEFDARLYPYGWDAPGFAPDARWAQAMELAVPANKPPASGGYPDYMNDCTVDGDISALAPREIPPMREFDVPVKALAESFLVRWKRDPADWFDCRMPDAFSIERKAAAVEKSPGAWELPPAAPGEGIALTFELPEQLVGWPFFTIDAPEGAVVEIMTQESHALSGNPWLDNHWFRWARLICREGENRF